MLLKQLFNHQDVLTPYFKFSHELKQPEVSAQLREIFKLRYEIYCLEFHYLAPEAFKNGLETDEYDACSTHFSAFSLDNTLIGSVRLVQPEPDQIYPFEQHCSVFKRELMPPRAQAGEVSRLVVKKTYRRRYGDSKEGADQAFLDPGAHPVIQPHSALHHREGHSPLLQLGLYREMYRYSRQQGIQYWYAAMEKTLARSLEKMGFFFIPIGPETDYYGPVTPFIVSLSEANQRLHRDNPFLAAWFNDEPIALPILLMAMVKNYIPRFFRKTDLR